MTRLIKSAAFVLIALAIIDPASALAETGYIRLAFKEQVEVEGDQIKMADLIKFITGATPALEDEIKRLVVDQSPAPGQTKILHPTVINGLLTYNKLKLERVQAQIPARVIVSRPAQHVDRKELIALFEQGIMSSLSWEPEEVRIEQVKCPDRLTLPVGAMDIQFTGINPTRLPGRLVCRAVAVVDGVPAERFTISAWVRFFHSTVTAARPLSRNQILAKSDVTVGLVELKGRAGRWVDSVEEIIGKRLRRRIKAGQPIRSNMVDNPPLVRRGDKVVLEARKGRLLITAVGLVQDNKASKGDQVRVLNTTTKKEVIGLLVSANLVRVLF